VLERELAVVPLEGTDDQRAGGQDQEDEDEEKEGEQAQQVLGKKRGTGTRLARVPVVASTPRKSKRGDSGVLSPAPIAGYSVDSTSTPTTVSH
jgi:hypothetical protein